MKWNGHQYDTKIFTSDQITIWARSGKPKTMDSDAVLKTKETNLMNITDSPVGLVTLITLAKAFTASKLCHILPKYCKTFNSPSYFNMFTVNP